MRKPGRGSKVESNSSYNSVRSVLIINSEWRWFSLQMTSQRATSPFDSWTGQGSYEPWGQRAAGSGSAWAIQWLQTLVWELGLSLIARSPQKMSQNLRWACTWYKGPIPCKGILTSSREQYMTLGNYFHFPVPRGFAWRAKELEIEV